MSTQDPTACEGCEHFSGSAVSTFGVCMHKGGPTKVCTSKFWPGDGYYPGGCPKDPSPPTPPRRRPKMNKKRLGRTPRALADEWKNGRTD